MSIFINGRIHDRSGIRIGTYGPVETVDGNQHRNLGELVSNQSDGNSIIGWIEPACENAQWIAWFTQKGDLIIYTKRNYTDGHTGAVEGEPLRVSAH